MRLPQSSLKKVSDTLTSGGRKTASATVENCYESLIEYYQISLSVRDENTLEREIRPFKIIKDNYPKYLITLDNSNDIDHNGIKQIYAIKWLLGKNE